MLIVWGFLILFAGEKSVVLVVVVRFETQSCADCKLHIQCKAQITHQIPNVTDESKSPAKKISTPTIYLCI